MTQESLYRMARDQVERWVGDDEVWYWSPRFPERDPLIVLIEQVHKRKQVEEMTEAVMREYIDKEVASLRAAKAKRQLDFDLAEPS